MTKTTNNILTTIFTLTMFSFALPLFANMYPKFIDNIGLISGVGLYPFITGIILLLSSFGILLLNQTENNNITKIILIFAGLGILTIINNLFNEYSFGGIIGNINSFNYGISGFIAIPLLILIASYLYKNNKNALIILITTFILTRTLIEFFSNKSVTFSNDFLAIPGFLSLMSLLLLKPINEIKTDKSAISIISLIGIVISIISILFIDNNSAKLLLILTPITYLFITKTPLKKISWQIAFATPVIITILIYMVSTIPNVEKYTAIETLWVRSMYLDMAISSMDIRSFFIGSGWGDSGVDVIGEKWVDGISLYPGNATENTLSSHLLAIKGMNLFHTHNDLIEYLFSGGILITLLYITLNGFIGYSLRNTPVVLSLFISFLVLQSLWFYIIIDITVYALFIALAVSQNKEKVTIKLNKINKYIIPSNGMLAITLSVFLIFTYTPYLKHFSVKIPQEFFSNNFYSANKTGGNNERYINRAIFQINLNNELTTNNASNLKLLYIVDSFDSYKRLYKMGNKLAIFELSTLYDLLFEDGNTENLNKIRKREFSNWATTVLEVYKNYPKLHDTSVVYLYWHFQRGFDEAIDEVTKRLLTINPENPVALYWRGKLFLKHNNDLGYKMIEDAFKLNITRYQMVDDKHYQKYKHLIEPRYR
ncbi:MAG: hypothetical protein ACPG8V_05085 [Alphaproteobacteria bacterium]